MSISLNIHLLYLFRNPIKEQIYLRFPHVKFDNFLVQGNYLFFTTVLWNLLKTYKYWLKA